MLFPKNALLSSLKKAFPNGVGDGSMSSEAFSLFILHRHLQVSWLFEDELVVTVKLNC